MSTLQVDLQFPTRFDLEFQAADGTRKRPYMIHRALFGSVERFFAILLEHYAGALPPWLSPVQVVGIPINADRHSEYLNDIAARLRAAGARVEVDTSDERMQKKIARAQSQKVPFMLLAGDNDVEAGTGEPAAARRHRAPRHDGRRGRRRDPRRHRAAELRRRGRGRRVARVTEEPPPSWRGYRPEFDEQAGAGLRDAFARLYTPHRLAYIKGENKPAEGDVDPFCRIPQRSDADGLIVARGEHVYAVLNLYPYNPGHLMVVPFRHTADYADLTPEETEEFGVFTQRSDPGASGRERRAGLQRRHQPRRDRRCRYRRTPAPACGAALGRRHQLHAGGRSDPGPAEPAR